HLHTNHLHLHAAGPCSSSTPCSSPPDRALPPRRAPPPRRWTAPCSSSTPAARTRPPRLPPPAPVLHTTWPLRSSSMPAGGPYLRPTATPQARGTLDLEAVALESEGVVILKPPMTMIERLYVEFGMEILEQVFRDLLKTQAIDDHLMLDWN
ncbi:unnamed protein product, partial [Urochloa humidicola]